MTDEVADHGAVLLLNPGLVVLAVGPGTGELDAPLGAVLGESIVDESIVDEYAVVVRLDAFDWEGQLSPDSLQSRHHQGLLPSQQWHGLGPAGADIGGHQAVDHGTPPGAAVVDHQVNLQESWWRCIPIAEGPHWNIAARRLIPPASEPAARRWPDGLEQPVQGGGAGRQQPLTHPRAQIQVAMRSMDSTRWGNAAFSRLPQIRSAGSQTRITASLTASS